MNTRNQIWPEASPPAYRKGSDDNNLAIIMQNPHSCDGSFADCESGTLVGRILNLLRSCGELHFQKFDWNKVHLINAWPKVELPKGNWKNQLNIVETFVQEHCNEFQHKIEGKDLLLFGEYAEAAYDAIRHHVHGQKVVRLWHPSGSRSRTIKGLKNYLNSRNVFPSLSNFQAPYNIVARNDLLAQLYADYIYLRWSGQHDYSFTFEKFLNKLYGMDD